VTADACPGLLELHQARDGQVARIRLPGSYATSSGLIALADLADRQGDGHVDLTARGNVQLRGIRPGAAGELARQAAAAGFLPSPAHDRARNITASPLAGLAGHPDLRDLVSALDAAILAEPALAALPGRFLFGLDDGSGRAGLGRCDVGLRWHPHGSELVLAGRSTGLRWPARPGIERMVAAARAFLDQREAAPGARMAARPDRGAGIAAELGGVLGAPVTDTVTRLPLGVLPDDTAVVVVGAPLARLTAAQLRLLASLTRPDEMARLAAAGRVVLPLARPVTAAVERLAGAGLLVSDDHELAPVTACSGLSCASSLADVRALAVRVPDTDAVHWAGCGRRCGLPPDAVAVVATSADRFTVGDGGRVLVAGARPA
jgi:precorrin-3B synthase